MPRTGAFAAGAELATTVCGVQAAPAANDAPAIATQRAMRDIARVFIRLDWYEASGLSTWQPAACDLPSRRRARLIGCGASMGWPAVCRRAYAAALAVACLGATSPAEAHGDGSVMLIPALGDVVF